MKKVWKESPKSWYIDWGIVVEICFVSVQCFSSCTVQHFLSHVLGKKMRMLEPKHWLNDLTICRSSQIVVDEKKKTLCCCTEYTALKCTWFFFGGVQTLVYRPPHPHFDRKRAWWCRTLNPKHDYTLKLHSLNLHLQVILEWVVWGAKNGTSRYLQHYDVTRGTVYICLLVKFG